MMFFLLLTIRWYCWYPILSNFVLSASSIHRPMWRYGSAALYIGKGMQPTFPLGCVGRLNLSSLFYLPSTPLHCNGMAWWSPGWVDDMKCFPCSIVQYLRQECHQHHQFMTNWSIHHLQTKPPSTVKVKPQQIDNIQTQINVLKNTLKPKIELPFQISTNLSTTRSTYRAEGSATDSWNDK